MQASALTARDLVCRRGDRLLFGGVDLSLGSGAAIHLVGPNGIGKTSLIRMLAGLLRPAPIGLPSSPRRSAGSVEWNGSIALLDDRPALDPELPLGKALAFWSRLDGGAVEVQRLGLSRLLDVPVRFLSTGQKKRSAFARLIGQAADHWLLDEPLNGLDAEGTRLVEAMIAERRAAGGVIVLASHQPLRLDDAIVLDLRRHPG